MYPIARINDQRVDARIAMLVQLAMTLSTIHGWSLPVDDKASSLSSHESAITGGFDGARDRLRRS